MQPFIERALLAKAQEMMDEDFSIHTARLLAGANADALGAEAARAQEFLELLSALENSAKLS